MIIVDSHCHLDDPRLRDQLPAVLARAQAAGVRYIQSICTRREDFAFISDLAMRDPHVFCSYGIHPHHADDDVASYDELYTHGQHPRVIALGETGLDYYYEYSGRARQEESFRTHIQAARALNLPVIIHSRDADADTIRVLADERTAGGPFKALLHCFSSGPALAEYAVAEGIMISFSGILTFKKATALRSLAQTIPLELLLVETDGPYLAPEPYRGKVGEPAMTLETLRVLADLRGLPVATLAAITTANFFRLFNKAQPLGGDKV